MNDRFRSIEGASPSMPRAEGIGQALIELGGALQTAESAVPQSDQAFVRALELIQDIKGERDEPALAEALRSIARYACVSGRSREGLKPSLCAVEMFRRLDLRPRLQYALITHGNLLGEIGNMPLAIETHAEALEVSAELGDLSSQAKILNNLGVVLIDAAQYADALPCLERVTALTEHDPSLRFVRACAFGNLAYACLHLEDYERGVEAARASIELQERPTTLVERLNRVIVESNYARLLLELGQSETARERCEIAQRLAQESGERAHLEADLAEGLCEVHSGLLDEGFARLSRALQFARAHRGVLADFLSALVKANEMANRPDTALVYLRELMMHTKDVHQENALLQHRLHLEQLNDRLRPTPSSEELLARREASLRGQLAQEVAQQELIKAQVEMLERIAVIADRTDRTGQHAYRVGKLAALLAQTLGWDESTVFLLELAARLHDIGEIGVPERLLAARKPLTQAEIELAQSHTSIGADILAQSNVSHIKMAEEIARFHHEHWDGSGYPFGLAGSAIPLAARITALADAYDEGVHPQGREGALSPQTALPQIAAQCGGRFDPQLTDPFVKLVLRLQREHRDLDAYLGQAARDSPFIQARRRIAATVNVQ